MGNSTLKYLIAGLFLLFMIPDLRAQDNSYNITPYPDLWFNSTDGIRVGIRLLGEQEGTFKDGPHRLDFGIWGASKWPENPLSYYVSFTEPISFWSSSGNELNIQLISSVRTGFIDHGAVLNKRFQDGFNELNYFRISASYRQQKLFNNSYPVFEQLWQSDWKSLLGIQLFRSKEYQSGVQTMQADMLYNVSPVSSSFFKITADIRQTFEISNGFEVGIRAYGGTSSKDVLPEFGFGMNFHDMNSWMDSGLMRAGGTVPVSLIENGHFQYASGPNLRGYASQEMKLLSSGAVVYYNSTAAMNLEIEYPNPVNNLWKDSIVEDILHFKTYGFADAGIFSTELVDEGVSNFDDSRTLADAGAGFQLSLNIPDYLGNDRGIAIRYEIPLWLSDPEGNDASFKFRSLIGIGTIIDF
ncbi:hypothetical protein AB2B38_001220 [Balneola sp. MJW-20]|uniref:hypothetical protein n=1 Tax=Gracilimonas aurantiaca TaxID=3234185 RepID=UPI0034679D03